MMYGKSIKITFINLNQIDNFELSTHITIVIVWAIFYNSDHKKKVDL